MLKTVLKKFYNTLPVGLLFCATIFIFAPFEIYLNNSLEFNYSFLALCSTIIPKAILFWLCVSVLLTIVPEKFNINKRISSILFITVLLLIIQGMFLTKGYGVLDGATTIEKFSAKAMINLAIWSIGLIIGIVFYNFLYNHRIKLCAILIITQAIPLGLGIYNSHEPEASDKDLWYRNYKIDENKNLFSYSKDENIIFIVADSFPYDTLEKILSEKEYRDMFSGFHSFSDVASNFPTTAVSITTFLTGKIYDNSIPRNDFIKNSFLSQESLPMFLKNKGYRLKTDKVNESAYITPELFDNVVDIDKKYLNINISSLINATLFKYLPHYFKQNFVTVNASKKLSGKVQWEDAGILKEINESKFNLDSQTPTFTFLHLRGSHPPFTVDENLNTSDIATEISQSKATLKLISTFMNKLKDIGVYDNTTILIVSDHTIKKNDILFPNHAILMIKNTGLKAINSIKEIDTPISLSDVNELTRWTVTNKGKNVDKFEGKTPRRYYDYIWEDSWEFQYMPKLTEYLIPENVSKQNLYIKTGKIFNPNKANSFPLGKEIDLAKDYKDIKNTIIGSWKKVPNGMIFYNTPNIIRNISSIIIGDKKPHVFRIDITLSENGQEKTAASYLRTTNNNLYLPFLLPEHMIIKSILVSIDEETHIPISYGESFGNDDQFKRLHLYGKGWVGSENTHMWSIAQESTIPLLLEHTPRSDLTVTILAGAFLGKKLPQQSMDILVNGSIVKSVKFSHEVNAQNINFIVPKSLINDNRILITFMLKNKLTSPYIESGHQDFRELGISLSSLKISELPHVLLKNSITLSTNDFGHIIESMEGWHRSENTNIWSSDKKSNLRLSLENPPKNDVEITFRMRPFLTEKFNTQVLDIIIDGKIIKTIDYKYGDNQDSFAVDIPKSLFINNAVNIIFSLKKELTSPKKEGISPDDRLLGINLASITLHERN